MPEPDSETAGFKDPDKGSNPIRAGLLGAGRIAQLFHIPIINKIPGVELVAIADADEGLRRKFLLQMPQATVYSDFSELIRCETLDAVVICLPPSLHAGAAQASLEQGLHIYVEKPLATSLDDGKRVVEAWKAAGTVGWMGFNLRFNPLLGQLRNALREGVIGDLVSARTCFSSSGRNLPDWKRRRVSGGGALLDLASHQFDTISHLLGRGVEKVSAQLNSQISEEDTASVQLRMDGGQPVSVITSTAAIEQHRMTLTGTRGELIFDRYLSSRLQFIPARRDWSRSARLASARRALGRIPTLVGDALIPPREKSFEIALGAFFREISNQSGRNGTTNAATLEDGLFSLACVIAAEQSARSGHTVKITDILNNR